MKKKPTPFKSRVAPKPPTPEKLRSPEEVKNDLREHCTRAGDLQFQIRCTSALLEHENQRLLELNQELARILEATKAEETRPAPPPETRPVSEATH